MSDDVNVELDESGPGYYGPRDHGGGRFGEHVDEQQSDREEVETTYLQF